MLPQRKIQETKDEQKANPKETQLSFLGEDDTYIQVHLNKLECRGKVHLFQ